MTEPTPFATAAPDRLLAGRYRLVRLLARGGMAEVWEATDEVLTRPVAAKVLLPHLANDDAFVARFRREAVAAARLSHPHIVSIYDTVSADGVEAIVMELVRGSTLRAHLDDEGALDCRLATRITAQVADALGAAHRQGLVHRDVKPGNILLADDGRVLVADFGIAKAAEAASDLTEAGQVVGTAKYLAPEQVEGLPLDARCDVYALGVVLYEMVCGRAPFVGDNPTATAMARLTGEPLRPRQIRASIPRSLEAVIRKAMARQRDDRYASAADLRVALEAVDLRSVERDGDATVAVGTDATKALAGVTSNGIYRPVPSRDDGDPTPVPAATRARRQPDNRPSPASLALLVIVALILGLVGVLLGRTGWARNLLGDDPGQVVEGTIDDVDDEAAQVAIASVAAFDPLGDGGDREHGDEAGRAVDGDLASFWRTETYRGELSATKAGVGLVLNLGGRTSVEQVALTTASTGYAAEVYVAEAPAADLAGWGEVRARREPIDGDAVFEVGGAEGSAVLVWLTDVGNANRTEIGEVKVFG